MLYLALIYLMTGFSLYSVGSTFGIVDRNAPDISRIERVILAAKVTLFWGPGLVSILARGEL